MLCKIGILYYKQNYIYKIFKNLNGTYMHYSKGPDGCNPWEGMGGCIL